MWQRVLRAPWLPRQPSLIEKLERPPAAPIRMRISIPEIHGHDSGAGGIVSHGGLDHRRRDRRDGLRNVLTPELLPKRRRHPHPFQRAHRKLSPPATLEMKLPLKTTARMMQERRMAERMTAERMTAAAFFPALLALVHRR